MSNDFGDNIISISDEEGNNYQLEHLDTFTFEDNVYMVFVPADRDVSAPDYGLLLLRSEEEDGEDYLANLDEEEEQRVYEYYMRILEDQEEDDED